MTNTLSPRGATSLWIVLLNQYLREAAITVALRGIGHGLVAIGRPAPARAAARRTALACRTC